jgi:hypothetical protein
VIGAIRRCGFSAVPARTNNIEPRLRSVEKWLGMLIDGKAGFLIDKAHNPELVTALASRYRFKKKKEGELDIKPEKKHPWSDLADALQYACLGSNKQVMAKALRISPSEDLKRMEPNVAGWT